jgi:hypothetical protein
MADVKISALPVANDTDTLTRAGVQNSATVQIPGSADLAQTIRDLGYTPAPIDSPTFTGDPKAPTPSTGDNDTSIATTAFVKGQNYITALTAPVTSVFTRTGAVAAISGDYSVGQVTGAAPLASPTFTGDPQAPTPPLSDDDTSIATTAFVKGQNYGTGSGYATILDIDFSIQPNQTLGTDVTFTIDGYSWTKINSINDNVAMAIVNGSGLVIQPKSTGNWFGATRTSPAIHIDLPTLLPNYYLDTPLRIWMYISVDNLSANGDNVGVILDNLGTSTTGCQAFAYRGKPSGTSSFTTGGYIGSETPSAIPVAANLNNTDRVIVYSFPTGRYAGVSTGYKGGYSGDWPSQTNIVPFERATFSTGTLSIANNIVTGLPMQLVLSAMRNGSGTNLNCTIARIRIDYKDT